VHEILLLSKTSRQAVGPTELLVEWIPTSLLMEIKWLGREADYSCQSRATVKNEWMYVSISLYAFRECTEITLSLI